MQAPLVICDVNNFFSVTGGGVRRYHLEKLRALAWRSDLEYHVIVPSDRAEIERYGRATIHHMPAAAMGGSGYRLMLNPVRLRKVLRQINPDVIEVGSPYVLPDLVRVAARGLDARIVGFWHAHYPVAYMQRPVAQVSPWLSRIGERLGWWWAKRTYGRFDATMAAANTTLEQLTDVGVAKTAHTPLGVDLELFTPMRRDDALRRSWGAGPKDVVLGFPHRLCDEKNLSTLIEAYELVRRSGYAPHLVFAGSGPDQQLVEALAAKYKEVHFLGYLHGREEVARLLASVDVVAALSPTETFGLSAAEAMAAGAALIGSDELSVGEMLRDARCGIGVPDRDAMSIANAWMELLKPGRARLLGARGAAYAVRVFSWQRTFEKITEVYRDIAGPVQRPGHTAWTHAAHSGAVRKFGTSIVAMIDDSRPTAAIHVRPTVPLGPVTRSGTMPALHKRA
jgi:alpha-1,6-mannosyltransferase